MSAGVLKIVAVPVIGLFAYASLAMTFRALRTSDAPPEPGTPGTATISKDPR